MVAVSPVAIAFYAGEFTPLERIVAMQTGPAPVLYGRAYRDNAFAFHQLSVRARRPEVLVLGSSRVWQWRSLFFHKRPGVAYVAGGRQSIEEVRAFLRELTPDVLPKVVIVGFDQRWLLDRYGGDPQWLRERHAPHPGAPATIDFEKVPAFGRVLTVNRQVLEDLWNRKITLARIIAGRDAVEGARAVGVKAVMKGIGLRNDGSAQNGADTVTAPSLAPYFAEGYEYLARDAGQFIKGDAPSERLLTELEQLLAEVRGRGGIVLGFGPPFAPRLYRALRADGAHDYLQKLPERLESLFARFGFSYFDFTDPGVVGGLDSDMLDAWHPSEYLDLLMYLSMLRARPDVLGAYSELSVLERLVGEAPDNRFHFIRNRF